MVNFQKEKLKFVIKKDKSFYSISGQLGVHLVNNLWLIIKKCLREEVMIGGEMYV